MSAPEEKISAKVFDAAASPIRLQTLRLLNAHGPLTYSEIMNRLNLNPNRDAGKFAYHLRNIVKAELVDLDEEAKKYKLTSLGRMVIAFSRNLEDYALREHRRLLVRTSRIAMEEFDRGKIAQALVREAEVPADLAQKVAEETEERLLKLDTLYLTAPLIREFVNAVLIEKGLHEYRHKLTRLGLPVYDVTQLIKSAEETSSNVEEVHRLAGDRVIKEYVLLNALPREVADAHLSGTIHVSNTGTWTLKANEFQHDLRSFLRRGLKTTQLNSRMPTLNPPKTFNAALTIVSSVLGISAEELSGEQGINHFNVFLAPFVRGIPVDELRERLKLFIFSVNQQRSNDVTLGLDPVIPRPLVEAEAFGVGGERVGVYGDYQGEANEVFAALLEVMFEDDSRRPIFNLNLILNLTKEALADREIEPQLFRAHELAARCGTPTFVNLANGWQEGAAYLSSGSRLAPDWTGDWEIDTIRTGILDSVILNLPRLAYEARGSDGRLFEGLDHSLEMAGEALRIKRNAIEERVRSSLLPLLAQSVDNESYVRLKSASSAVSFVGLNEVSKVQTGYQIHENEKALNFAVKLVEHMATRTKKLSRELGLRLALAQTPSEEAAQRVAELDVERYGWAVVYTQGTREAPYYTDLMALPLEAEFPLGDRLQIEAKIHPLTQGGHLAIIDLDEPEQNPEYLMRQTDKICGTYTIGAFAYNRGLSHCANCKKTYGGLLRKCPSCGSTASLTLWSRSSARYLPLQRWPMPKRMAIDRRFRYMLS